MSLSAETAQLADVAWRLRHVKDAYREFLTRWAVERMADDAEAMQRLADDMDGALQAGEASEDGRAEKNPYDTGWTGLYRGPDLDD
jgi:hypothetical protein